MKIDTLKLNTNAPISILIGENGCGKSQVLSALATASVDDEESVIAIATSVYDKFPRKNFRKKYHYIGGRLGRNMPREAVKQSISRVDQVGTHDFKFFFRILEYVKYDQRIGFKVKGITNLFEETLENIEEISEDHRSDLKSIMYSLSSSKYDAEFKVLWFDRNNYYHERLDEFLFELLSFEALLKKHKLIKSIDVFLSKKGQIIPLDSASSGELSLISTLVFISSFIDYRTVILIDEPENSLHPKWQKEYISNIMNLFSYYEPKVIVATHSPMIISGLHNEVGVEIHKYTADGFIKSHLNSKNAEDLYDELFDIVTPASRSLSNKCAEILNQVSEKRLSYSDAISSVNVFIDKSYDEIQVAFLQGIKELLNQLNVKENN